VSASGRVPFVDLRLREDGAAVRAAIERVLARGWFVLGPEVERVETELAAASGAAHAVGVASGTDAIALLIADVDPDTLTLDPACAAAAITPRTRAIIAVHLYGQAADLRALHAVAERHGLALIEDCCQAHLATSDGAPVGTTTAGGALSFYPTKNLAALGDGGAVITNDRHVAERVRRLRNGGQRERAVHVEAGVNSRLDELQAAVLRARLPSLPELTARRRALAALYRTCLPPQLRAIAERDRGHVYHLFPIRSDARDRLQAHLRDSGIETLIHYPMPLSEQPAFLPYAPAVCPVAAQAARELLSLPLYPAMADDDVFRTAEAAAQFFR
jgi:dTDP-3-amino-3,4,6-trideoxy-alpha-D-glucose transaminase